MRSSTLLLATCWLAAVSSCAQQGLSDDGGRAPLPDLVVEVTTARVRLGEISQLVVAPGSVIAKRESRIGAEVSGPIAEVYVSEGDRVEAGQPLFQIDAEPYEIGLRQAEAVQDVARAERLQIAADLRRGTTLRHQNVMAQQELDRLATSLAVAQARERQASEAVALARHNLDRTRIVAPYAGSIAARLADEGTTALVQPQTIVIVLQETDELEASAAIPESQLALVQLGDAATIRVEGIPEPIRTQVSAVSDSIDPATRTYMVKMKVPNRDRRLKAGVFAHVRISPQPKRQVVLVPRQAVRTEDGRTRVFAVRDGRAVAVPVDVGMLSEQDAEILHGLSSGDEIIVGAAAQTIAPEMAVRVSRGAADAP